MHTLKLYYGVRLYTNRIVGETLPDPKYTFNNINFILGDGITTTQTINNVNSEESPTYLTATDENNKTTEWFVISSYKNRKNQLTLSLRRDFLDEYWDILKNQPFICQKAGTIPDQLSDAKYKKTMNLSQVKTESIPLWEDPVLEGYIVGYYAKNTITEDKYGTPIVTDGNIILNYPTQDPGHTYDSGYDIFAIPVGKYTYRQSISTVTHDSDANITRKEAIIAATSIATAMGTDAVYDLQYLPYLPFPKKNTFKKDNSINWVSTINFSGDSSKHAAILYLNHSSGIITMDLTRDNSIDYTNTSALDQRKENEKKMYRLSSPTQASSFDFSPVLNNGLHDIIIEVCLKPYTPYIYLQPDFNGLYGSRFYDGRGLILSGDYSLTQISNKWTDYQIQNKNFMLSFDREVQSMELSNWAQNRADSWGTLHDISSTITGAISGAAIGGILSPGLGAVTGIGSLATGMLDIQESAENRQNQRLLREDSIKAAKDQFQYQIGNIKALPNTLRKVTALTPDYKVFPQLEVYECTAQESANLDNAIKYNGLDINIITSLGVFDHGFIEGMILKFPSNININEAQAGAINEELSIGIYYKEA